MRLALPSDSTASMAIDRRRLLGALIAAAVTVRFGTGGARAMDGQPLYVSCRMDAAQAASVAVFTPDGETLLETSLPARGHDIAQRPHSREFAVFARRPGTWAVIVDASHIAEPLVIKARTDRHFFGHGIFSADGRLLYVSENNVKSGDGIIGIYDAADGYRRIGEFASGGIGPHDLTLLSDGRHLAIANGGLKTLPESGREILNSDDITPNLAVINLATGDVVTLVELERQFKKLSVRHLARTHNDGIVFACQHQGDADELPPLVGIAKRGEKARLFEAPDEALARLNNYVGSVALDRSGTVIAATSPQGGEAALWSINGRYLGGAQIPDVCGVASHQNGFLVSSGNAGVRSLSEDSEEGAPVLQRWIWDNHMRLVAI
jgi:hypothetical protein